MELQDGTADIVHPEVRAHINSLIAAVGGTNPDDDGRYQLGDDALEVLRDIKRWIRFYDEKTNRMDVARCLHGGNLIEGDLLPILSLWPENTTESKYKSRIALACFEIMVPLTWPMERDKERMTVNHHRHMPVLEMAQVQYKRAIINYDGARVLHAAVRTALPSLALPAGDRVARDQGIIKLTLFFLRNMAMIAPPPNAQYDGDESQVSRSSTIDAFSYQDIFLFLLTIASNMGEEFNTEDTTVMEIIYHLVKRVDVEKLFMNERQASNARAKELSSLMSKEASMLQAYNRSAPTRHNRFGTMVWVKRDDGKMSSLSGQDALANTARRNQKMDSSKKFKPPRRGRKGDRGKQNLGPPAKLNARASGQLRSFVEEFLDSGFNPLFSHARRSIDREAPHVMQYHRRQFFYLVAWFLEAERTRRASRKTAGKKGQQEDVSSFNLVAGVLNQEMFITLNRSMNEAYEIKDWQELTAVMRCFTQILLTIQEMMESGNEEDEEIADNVMSRLFYEETTHDTIANIVRTYKDQGFDYLDAATELVHHFLRILEAYSKQNVDMQIRSRKRSRRKKAGPKNQAAAGAGDGAGSGEVGNEEGNDDSADDGETAERTSRERKFDFQRFVGRFTPQAVVDTFVALTKFYHDLDDAQLKRAHRYFYRLAFKQEMSVMLFRVDIVHLLYNMIKGPEPLDKASGMYRDWEELVKQILRKCVKKMEQRPELIIEMLFSKLQSTAFFLEFGYEKQTVAAKRAPKPAPELVFKYTEERDRQIAIAVGALLDRNNADDISWVKTIVAAAESERRAWAAAEEAMALTAMSIDDAAEAGGAQAEQQDSAPRAASLIHVKPDSDARRTSMFKNSYLRLLLNLCGFRLFGPASEETPESPWVLPSDITADSLQDALHFINQAEFSPPTFDEGQSAESQLKRKAAPRKKAAMEESEDEDEDDDIEALFAPGGPTARKVVDEDERGGKKKKKTNKRRRRGSQLEPLDDAALDERARKRREREREKARKIKSALYVHEGDDEFDEEEDAAFFAREREIAARAAKAAAAAKEPVVPRTTSKRAARRVSSDGEEEEEEEEEEEDEQMDDAPSDDEAPMVGRKKRRLGAGSDNEDEGEDEDDEESEKAGGKADVDMGMGMGMDMDVERDVGIDGLDGALANGSRSRDERGDGEDEQQDVPVAKARRPRVRGGFVVESDDDE